MRTLTSALEKIPGIGFCLLIAIPSVFLGQYFPIIGAPVFAILFGILVASFLKVESITVIKTGLTFSSKKILQWAVILLGFGLNLNVIFKIGITSLPIIISTILIAFVITFIFYKITNISNNLAILIGVGSAICGGSAIAATAPVVKADENEIAQSVSVVFLFNVLAALIFPTLGMIIGFNTHIPDPFAIFAGTAVNDTSSVTAAASTWDSLHNLGSKTLDMAVTVKLTRTLAIIPITFVLAIMLSKQENSEKSSIKNSFPTFILYFLGATILTTVITNFGVQSEVFDIPKMISKFFIVLAMSAIGLNTSVKKIMNAGYKPILLGFSCWVAVTLISLFAQKLMGIW